MRFCILRDSDKLRAAVGLRIKTLGLTPFRVSEIMGGNIRLAGLSKFLKGQKTDLTQMSILKVCDFLGIAVSLKIEFLE